MDKITSPCFDLTSYQTDYLRPIPIIFNSDFQWDDNMAINNVQWNYSLEVNHDKVSQVREIIQNTCTTEISDEEQKVLALFDDSRFYSIIYKMKKTCLRIADSLVKDYHKLQKNKEIAHFLLISICHFDGFEEYLDVFIQSDVTQNSLELFAQLFGELKLPLEYITQYINYCIEYCNNIKEKQQQNKLVRYVSIFIQHMLKQKAFATKDVLTNLQAFCIEFSKVGEVSKLLNQLKHKNPRPCDTYHFIYVLQLVPFYLISVTKKLSIDFHLMITIISGSLYIIQTKIHEKILMQQLLLLILCFLDSKIHHDLLCYLISIKQFQKFWKNENDSNHIFNLSGQNMFLYKFTHNQAITNQLNC